MMTNPHDEREQASVDKIAALLERSSLGTPAARAARNRTPLSRGQRIADMKTSAADAAVGLRPVTTAGGHPSAQASTGQEQPAIRHRVAPPRAWSIRILPSPEVMTTLTETDTAAPRPVDASLHGSPFLTPARRDVTPWRIPTVAAPYAVNTAPAQHHTIKSVTNRPYEIAKTSMVTHVQGTTKSWRSRWEATRPIYHGGCHRSIMVFIADQGSPSSALPDHVLPFVDGDHRTAPWWTAMSTGVADAFWGFGDGKSPSTQPGTFQAFVVHTSSGMVHPSFRPGANNERLRHDSHADLWHDSHADFLVDTGHDVTSSWRASLVHKPWGTVWKSGEVHFLGSEDVAEFVTPWITITSNGGEACTVTGGVVGSPVTQSAEWPLITPPTSMTRHSEHANCLESQHVSATKATWDVPFARSDDGGIAWAGACAHLVAEIRGLDAATVAGRRASWRCVQALNGYLDSFRARCTDSSWKTHLETAVDGGGGGGVHGLVGVSGVVVESQLGDVSTWFPNVSTWFPVSVVHRIIGVAEASTTGTGPWLRHFEEDRGHLIAEFTCSMVSEHVNEVSAKPLAKDPRPVVPLTSDELMPKNAPSMERKMQL